jgi:hypothetical protein
VKRAGIKKRFGAECSSPVRSQSASSSARRRRSFVEASRNWSHRRRRPQTYRDHRSDRDLAAIGLGEREKKLEERASDKKHNVELNSERAERLVEQGDPAGAFLFFQRALAADLEKSPKRLPSLLSGRHLDAMPGRGSRSAGSGFFQESTWNNFASAFLQPIDPARERLHRLRLGATWPQLPRLEQLFQLPELTHCEISPDGKFLVGNSETAAALWQLGSPKDEPTMLLHGLVKGQVKWAAFTRIQRNPSSLSRWPTQRMAKLRSTAPW